MICTVAKTSRAIASSMMANEARPSRWVPSFGDWCAWFMRQTLPHARVDGRLRDDACIGEDRHLSVTHTERSQEFTIVFAEPR